MFAAQTPIFQVPVLAGLIWLLRLCNEAVATSSNFVDSIWLPFLRPLTLACLGIWWSSLFVRSFELNTRRKFWLWAFCAAAVFCIPYGPDMYASFVKAGEKSAIALSVAFYTLGILTYGIIRGGSCVLCSVRFFRRIPSLPIRSTLLYVTFLFSEFMFFHTWHPITYFPALPLPLPATAFFTGSTNAPVSTVLFETNIDGETRARIAQGSNMALSMLGSKLAQNAVDGLRPLKIGKSLTLILPETLVNLSDVSDAQSLFMPVASSLFAEFGLEKLVWIQGAFVSNNNVVLGSEIQRHNVTGEQTAANSPPVFVLRKKAEQMPMFEAPSKGVSYSAINNDGTLREQAVDPRFSVLRSFVDSNVIMICYESLFPSNWRFGKPAVVLTNHHMFNEFKLMNWVYFGFLRQLSFLFRAPAKVVSNYNPSGMLSVNGPELPAASGVSEGWTVVRYR